MEECLFCRIAKKELASDVVYEDNDVFAFRDIHPKYKVHILVIPKQHIHSVAAAEEADEPLLGKVLRTGAEIARQEGIADSGFRLSANNGMHAEQAVDHLHVHVLGGEPLRPL